MLVYAIGGLLSTRSNSVDQATTLDSKVIGEVQAGNRLLWMLVRPHLGVPCCSASMVTLLWEEMLLSWEECREDLHGCCWELDEPIDYSEQLGRLRLGSLESRRLRSDLTEV